jgi:hypothetical protein
MASQSTMNVIPKDTDIAVFAKYLQILSKLSIEQKLKMLFELNENMRSLMKTGIKMQHPEFTDQQVIHEIIRRVYGVDVETKNKSEP